MHLVCLLCIIKTLSSKSVLPQEPRLFFVSHGCEIATDTDWLPQGWDGDCRAAMLERSPQGPASRQRGLSLRCPVSFLFCLPGRSLRVMCSNDDFGRFKKANCLRNTFPEGRASTNALYGSLNAVHCVCIVHSNQARNHFH